MTLTKEQAQWLVGAIDLRVKTEGLQAAGQGIGITALIQADFNDQVPSLAPTEGTNGADQPADQAA